jgi:hypothetical protein
MVTAYWKIGKRIVEEEQKGKSKASYGAALLKELSERLKIDFGKGYSETNLKYFRQFYLAFPIMIKVTQCVTDSELLTKKVTHCVTN